MCVSVCVCVCVCECVKLIYEYCTIVMYGVEW